MCWPPQRKWRQFWTIFSSIKSQSNFQHCSVSPSQSIPLITCLFLRIEDDNSDDEFRLLPPQKYLLNVLDDLQAKIGEHFKWTAKQGLTKTPSSYINHPSTYYHYALQCIVLCTTGRNASRHRVIFLKIINNHSTPTQIQNQRISV